MTAASPISPLHDIHVEANASFTDFAGWQMPVRYASDLTEHAAVRTAAGIFDLSHMAELSIRGPQAGAFLDYALAGELSSLALGQAKYSLLLTERGTIVDDVVVYRTGESAFLVVANAGNHVAAFEALLERTAGFDVGVADESDGTALIAVQGPRSFDIVLATAGISFGDSAKADGAQVEAPRPDAGHAPDAHPLAALKYYRSLPATYGGEQLLVARTGYTGEDGFELYVDAALAPALWRDLMAAGEPFGLVAAGLASRDTLRLEAGMPLYGHELSLDITPVQAGLGRVPNFGKGDFVGRAALEAAVAAESVPRVLVGLIGDGKRAARAGYQLFATDDSAEVIGEITSGALSPTLGVPIALAYVDPAFAAADTEISVDVRGKRLTFRVTPVPFYRRKRD
jgi:aminomethyltransferase